MFGRTLPIFLALLSVLSAEPVRAEDPLPAVRRIAGPSNLQWTAKMDLALSTLPGKPARLGKLKKKVTLLVLWAMYCEPCLVELPYVDALFRKFRNDPDVAILSLNEDSTLAQPDLGAIRALIAQHKLEVPVRLDSRRETEALVKKAFGVPMLPLPRRPLLRRIRPLRRPLPRAPRTLRYRDLRSAASSCRMRTAACPCEGFTWVFRD